MKKVIVLFVVMAASMMLLSCKESLPKRLDAFVDNVDRHADSFSQDDWNKANAQFEKLVNEFQENQSAYNAEEKKQINAAVGKYMAIVAKSGVNNLLDGIGSLFDGLGGFLQGLGFESDETEKSED